jgi:putative CocE/NonD family hydrolase
MEHKVKFREAMAFGAAVGAEVAVEKWAGNVHGRVRSKIGRVNLFVMGDYGGQAGDVGNYWTSLETFPNATSQTLHLDKGGLLSTEVPEQGSSIDYIYDPRNESGLTPWNGGNVFHLGHVKNVASVNQTFREGRDDVLVFDSDPLVDDLAIVGQIRAKLFVSSSAKDTDFFVTVTDLAPGKQTSMLVRHGNCRMRWRDSEIKQAPFMSPGVAYEINVDLLHTAYIFPKGHSVRVTVASAAYPYHDPNPNTGDLVNKSLGSDKWVVHLQRPNNSIVAKNTIHMGASHPSSVSLPVVGIREIPKNPHFGPSFPPISTQSAVIV